MCEYVSAQSAIIMERILIKHEYFLVVVAMYIGVVSFNARIAPGKQSQLKLNAVCWIACQCTINVKWVQISHYMQRPCGKSK